MAESLQDATRRVVVQAPTQRLRPSNGFVVISSPLREPVRDRPALYQAILGASKGNLVLKNAIDRVVAQLGRPPPPTDWIATLSVSGPILLGQTACSTLNMQLDDGTNQGWVDSHTACFGDSIKSNGHCIIGKGVIAIAHSTGSAYICPTSRRVRAILSRTQASIEQRMAELNTHYKDRHYEYKDFNYTKKPMYTYPNPLSARTATATPSAKHSS